MSSIYIHFSSLSAELKCDQRDDQD